MAQSAVTLLLANLSTLIQDESRLLGSLREEVQYIKDELEHMRAFLNVADTKQETDAELKVWVKQVREVADDAQDAVDEFVTQFTRHRANRSSGYLPKMYYSAKNLRVRHQIASEIKSIRSRIRIMSEGHKRFESKYNSTSEQGSSSALVSNSMDDFRGNALLIDEAKLVGIERPKNQLMSWLLDGNDQLKFVSVMGMGGLGKTTLVRKVYEDIDVKRKFQVHAWITVSQSFNTKELFTHLIKELHRVIEKSVPRHVLSMNSDDLRAFVKDFLQNRKYLLVFDDVWNIDSWDRIKYALPDDNSGSRVMLTTRVGDVASASCLDSHGHILRMKALSQEDSWTLFCHKTFANKPCPPYLEDVSRRILSKCEGLPFAIVSIGGVLALKEQSRVDQWEMFYRSLGAELQEDGALQRVKKIIALSYIDLPENLRICLLFFSIFPEDHEIEPQRLIRLWIAEGFIPAEPNRTREEVAESYLEKLIQRSLIQVVKTSSFGRLSRIRVHDILREIILAQSREQNMATIASDQNTEWPEKVRRLAIHGSFNIIQERNSFKHLRSLLVFHSTDILSVPLSSKQLFGTSRKLKVLDLRYVQMETIPREIFDLFHLKYLNLRDTKLKIIPKLIRKLTNLETLNLKDTGVTELPIEILKLKKLRNLIVYRYCNGVPSTYYAISDIQSFKAPYQIGGLLSLQKLCYIEADELHGVKITRELGKLSQLRKLGITKLRRDDGMDLCHSLEKLINLQSLFIFSINDDEIIDLQHSISSTHPFLRTLVLRGPLERMPQWISSLASLSRLWLRFSMLREDPLVSLENLPSLVELSLSQAYAGEELSFKAGGFLRLKELYISSCQGLRRINVEQGALPNLQKLIISNCKLVEEVPLGIEHLSKIQYLRVIDMADILVTKLQAQDGGVHPKIVHVPVVIVANWISGRWERRYLTKRNKE